MRLATRASPLARWQTDAVADLLRRARPDLEVTVVLVDTRGDRQQDRPIPDIGGQGVFVKEVQAAVLDGHADMAVHSAKDLPSATAAGLLLAAVPARADRRDALVGSTLAALGPGATVATGSVRRRAQLAWARPDLTFSDLRGNIATRLGRRPAGGAVVVAAAALERLGLTDRAAELLDPAVMLPQVGQGAIAVECRASDGEAAEALAAIDDAAAHCELRAERAFLARLGGGCDLPVGASAHLRRSQVEIEGLIASLDGRTVLRTGLEGPATAAEDLGRAVAEHLLSHGGEALLADAGRAAGPGGGGAGPGVGRR